MWVLGDPLMSKTDSDASRAAPDTAPRRRSPLAEDERLPEARADEAHVAKPEGAVTRPVVAEEDGEPDLVVMSETVRRMGRRRTRVLAVLSLLVAIVVTASIVEAFMQSGSAPLEQATSDAWSSVTALSEGLRALGSDGELEPLRDEARTARQEVQAAGRRVKALELPVADTPLRSRVIRALRADDAWIDAVGSTLANPRSDRRGDLSRLAERAAVATSLVAEDVAGAESSVGGTGRLLSATRSGG